MRTIYFGFYKAYFSILATFCLWSIFLWPVFGYSFAPTAPLIAVILFIALVLRMTNNPNVHASLMVVYFVVYICFIVFFGMEVGEVGLNTVRIMNVIFILATPMLLLSKLKI